MTRAGITRVALAAAVGSGILMTLPARAGSSGSRTTTCAAPGGIDPDTVTLTGPATLWPPNHKMVDYVLTAMETPQEEGDNPGVSLSYMVKTTDVPGGDGGTVVHDPDANPAAGMANGNFKVSLPFQLRAERSGLGTGRTYEVDWMATFDNGIHPCNGSFTVTVPHDARH